MSDHERSNRDSVWSQFHSPVLENATAVELEGANFQEKARQVEIRKVRQSIEEMSVLLAEMQHMYQSTSSKESDHDEDCSQSDEYISALEATSPAIQSSSQAARLAKSPEHAQRTEQPPISHVSRKVPHIKTTPQRESLRASLVGSPTHESRPLGLYRDKEDRKHQHIRGHALTHAQHARRPRTSDAAELGELEAGLRVEPRRDSRGEQRGVSRGSQRQADAHTSQLEQSYEHEQSQRERERERQRQLAPKVPHKQERPSSQSCAHKQRHSEQHRKSRVSEPVRSATLPSPPRKLTEFTRQGIEERLKANDLSINELDLPTAERKLLERFINALSKLSVEVQMDEAKRTEGRRRMNIALNALEGWI